MFLPLHARKFAKPTELHLMWGQNKSARDIRGRQSSHVQDAYMTLLVFNNTA
jgi:hypothetical protein